MGDTFTFTDYVNTRQAALGVWLAILAGWAASRQNIRQPIFRAGAMLLRWKIAAMLLSMSAYVSLCVWALAQGGIWEIDQIVDTALWFILSAALLWSDVVTGDGSERILPRAIGKSVLVVVLVEFIVGFATFPLVAELLFVPFLFTLGALLAFAEWKHRGEPVHRFLVGIQGTVGLAVLVAAGVKVFREWSAVASVETVRHLIMAPALSLALVPFLWLTSIVASYEDLFLRHSLGPKKSRRIRVWFAVRMLVYCNISRAKVAGIRGRFPHEIMQARDRSAIRSLVKLDRTARKTGNAGRPGAA